VILSLLLSSTLTFTATATGVEKGTPVEFLFVGKNSDRDYESMFLLDESVDAVCRRIESSVPRGTPVDAKSCRLWPTGCKIRLDPPLDRFITNSLPKGVTLSEPIYTGGSRGTNGTLEAATVMPAAFFSTYSLAQSPIVYNDPVGQGDAYGRFNAAVKLEKGARVTFTLSVDEKSLPVRLDLTAEKGRLPQLLKRLQTSSAAGEIDACVSFSGDLTVEEATAVARAISVVDSCRVKINGARGLFYRAFLPLEKWRDRQERLQQPFELTMQDDGTDELVFIEEDWSVEGNDPKLTPRPITVAQVKDFPKTKTCFIYASRTQTVSRIVSAMDRMPSGQIDNWYVFSR